jgi:hypothetical protein
MKQVWRVKEKVDTPTPMTSDNDMDLLDNDGALLIKDGSPPQTGMDINMVFTLSTELRGIEEEVAQMCLDPVREARRVKPALEAIIHSRPHRWEADLLDARQQRHSRQPDAILHL